MKDAGAGTEPAAAGPGAGTKPAADPAATWVCLVCGWIYDPAIGDERGGIPPGVPFADLPDSWVCPECQAGKDQFEEVPA